MVFYTALVLPWFASHSGLAGEPTNQIQPSQLVGAWQPSMMITELILLDHSSGSTFEIYKRVYQSWRRQP